ncbi:uncharacterized protein LOC112047109 [Bicyclus anynana]|uniref:Uncharacterized protein LOC112047109 n=1 Tax=Bicyclus anynana TaxID=110368 RepID=A0ABM3M3K8_BICAN|nr:uncharacterized protein LOC112047109 [Bicyclus anynana]
MALERKCCVPNCVLDTEILHKFPNPNKDIDRFRTWIYNIGGDILAKDNEYIYKYRRVCHIHFEAKYHTRSKMLSPNAVPRLNLTSLSFVEKDPLLDITNQPANSPVEPATSDVSHSGECTITETTNQTLCIAPAMASTSAIIKQRPRRNEQQMLKTMKKLQKLNTLYKQRLKKEKNLATNTSFQKTLNKFKTLGAIFTKMQFREVIKPKMGRRFTKEEKIMAMNLYKLGPEVYRWLIKNGFVLPSPITLSRLLTNLK